MVVLFRGELSSKGNESGSSSRCSNFLRKIEADCSKESRVILEIVINIWIN